MPSSYFNTLAGYNAWANRRLYAACERLPQDEYLRERPSFFGSIHATLNHLLVTDRVWIARIAGQTPPQLALNQILYGDFVGLKVAREAEDDHIGQVIAAIPEAALDEPFDYANSKGQRFREPLRLVLAHLFNHQAHHRGQAHGLLSQTAAAAPPLDLILYLRQGAGAA